MYCLSKCIRVPLCHSSGPCTLTQAHGLVCLRGCLVLPTADDSKVSAASLLDLPSAELVAAAGKRIKSSLTRAEARLFPKCAGLKPVASASPGSLVGNAEALALVQTLRLRFCIEYDPQLGVCSHLRSSGLSIPCLCAETPCSPSQWTSCCTPVPGVVHGPRCLTPA